MASFDSVSLSVWHIVVCLTSFFKKIWRFGIIVKGTDGDDTQVSAGVAIDAISITTTGVPVFEYNDLILITVIYPDYPE